MDPRQFDAGYAAFRAADWDRAAACFSGSDAKSRIAQAYVWMNRSDEHNDPGKAFEIFRQLAEMGDPIACTDLGFCYYFGIGCEANSEKAFFWYEQAARMGFARAINNLSVCYLKGSGTQADPQMALSLLRRIEADGDGMILCNLGSANAAAGEEQQAILYYCKAAALGDPKAIRRLKERGEDVSAYTPVEPDLDAELFAELRHGGI